MDFKPRFMIALPSNKENETATRLDLCFYNYFKYHDIRCYDRNGEEYTEETVEHILDKYYWGNANPTYSIKFEKNPKIGDVWVCRCIGHYGTACFIGYSEFSALHALEDCENAKSLILERYYKPKDNLKYK
jgi:hypothetical protein